MQFLKNGEFPENDRALTMATISNPQVIVPRVIVYRPDSLPDTSVACFLRMN